MGAAVDNLLNTISSEPVPPDVSVGDFLRNSGGAQSLIQTLQHAELIGGPRWIDAQTCQVQLQISGPRVLAALKQIAAANPRASPLSLEGFDRLSPRWRNREYVATGTSISGKPAVDIRPAPNNIAWAHVRDEDRRQAVANAKKDAVDRILDSLRPLRLSATLSVGDVLQKPSVSDAMKDWLIQRPVVRADFRRDMQVELVLAVTPSETLDALRAKIAAAKDLKGMDLPAPMDDKTWASFLHDFEKHMASPIGCGAIPAEVARVKPVLPGAAPSWVNTRAQQSASAPIGTSKLKAALQAEALARRKLADQLDSLPLTNKLTVAQAAKQDARLYEIVTRVVAAAKISDTDYDDAHGKVSVQVQLDLRQFWDALRDLR